MAAKRGWNAGDAQAFSGENLERLHRAAAELSYLLDRGYPRESAITFVGNRYQFTQRQRLFLARAVCGEAAQHKRQGKCLPCSAMQGRTVYVDAFNTIITLEVALSGSLVVAAQDGTLRDLAGLSGTYHPIGKTVDAIDMLLSLFKQEKASCAVFFMDAPVSNSGRLAALIEQRARELGGAQDPAGTQGTAGTQDPAATQEPAGTQDPASVQGCGGVQVETIMVPDADVQLYNRELVVSSDSHVLDRCTTWLAASSAVLHGVQGVWALHAI